MYCSVEWLESELAKHDDPVLRKEIVLNFLSTASDFLTTECFEICERLHREAIATNDRELYAYTLLYLSFGFRYTGKTEEATRTFNEVVAISGDLPMGFASMIISQMIAFEYWGSGQRDLAFEYSYRSLKIGEAYPGEGRGWAYFQLGVFHYDLKDYDSSLRYFHMAEADALSIGLSYQLARTYSGIGGIHIARNDLEKGQYYNEKAIEGYRAVGHLTAISRALNDLGVICMQKGELEEAEKNLKEALDIRTQHAYAPGIITTRMELARLYTLINRKDEAEKLILEALELSEQTVSKQKAVMCHLMLVDVYKKKNDPWKALEHMEKYNALRAELTGEETSNKIQHLQQKFATEKAEAEAEIHRLRNVELAKLNAQIEEKNKSILDSILYAKRIQDSLLPPEKYIGRILRELNGI